MTMFEKSLQRVLRRWKEAFGQYEELKRTAESSVTRWEWADGERHSLLPYHFERYPGRGRALKRPPESVGSYIRYGFDAQDRLRLQRHYDYLGLNGARLLQRHRNRGFEVGNEVWETFVRHSDALVEIIQFSIRPGILLSRIPLKIEHIHYEDSRVARYTLFKLNGYAPLYSRKGKKPDALYHWLGPNGRFKRAEQYVYVDDRLTTVLLYHEQPGSPPFQAEERFAYDEAGALVRIERFFENGQSQLLFQRRKKGQTFGSIREAATRKLIEAITERLRTENIREKLCCVELSYRAVSRHFPPGIVLGLENDRRRLLESGDRDARYSVFAPALLGRPRWLQITDPATLEICSQLEQEIQAGRKWDTAASILRDVAVALNQHDWSGILDATPDFVVFPIDWEMEGDQLEQVLRACTSDEQIEEWRQKGWL
jgi:hypothetical protein